MELDDVTSILAAAAFFDICDSEQRRFLAFASERMIFGPGDEIYRFGEAADGAYVLVSGTVRINDDPTRPGQSYDFDEHGGVLGEIGLVLSRPRRATVTAATRVDAVFVPRTAYLKLMRQFPDLAEHTAERIRADLAGYMGAIIPLKGRIKGE